MLSLPPAAPLRPSPSGHRFVAIQLAAQPKKPGAKLTASMFNAIGRLEFLYAQISGHMAPATVNVDARQQTALVSLAANLTPERRAELVEQMKRRLAAPRALPPKVDVPDGEYVDSQTALEAHPAIQRAEATEEPTFGNEPPGDPAPPWSRKKHRQNPSPSRASKSD